MSRGTFVYTLVGCDLENNELVVVDKRLKGLTMCCPLPELYATIMLAAQGSE